MKLFGAIKNLGQWINRKLKGNVKLYSIAVLLQPIIVQQLTNLVVSNSAGKVPRYKAELFSEAAVSEFIKVLGGQTSQSVAENVIDKKLSDVDTVDRIVNIAKDKANLDDVTARLAADILLGSIKNLL